MREQHARDQRHPGDASHTATSPVEQAAPTAQASPPAPPTMPGPTPALITTHATVSGTSTGSNNPRPEAALSGGFATRHAYYEPIVFADLPGWDTDDVTASWEAFRRSCTLLGARSGWSDPCNAARVVDVGDVAAIRRFFETNFNAYQIRNPDRSLDGTMTGYYEPLLNGSRQYGGAYLYPVYGTPADMLYLDARRLPDRARGDVSTARIDGRNVIPLSDTTSGDLKGVYALDLRDSVLDIRDKKIRLRLDGGRIVPYCTRAEIERGALKAPILACVDDPVMLYSMQLQGAGKVRMSDGSIRRFAYAEQNGRPFLPPLAHSGNATAGARKLVVRGMEMEVDIGDDGAPATSNEGNAAPADGDDGEPTSPLLRGFTLATTTPKPHPAYAVSDPSYVFFRVIPDSPNGPLGALGVPAVGGPLGGRRSAHHAARRAGIRVHA